ncbi:MAG: bifunctional nuclease family protein [candidate division WOR-3 bacterium]|nr:bifunctional nuclease family protein [candidate division WOR-3 bacterium]
MVFILLSLIEVEVHGLLSAGDGYIVVLSDKKSKSKFLTMTIGKTEGEAIMIAKESIMTPRPLTHELAFNLVKNLDGEISRIEIYDLRDGVYYAKIYLTKKTFIFKTQKVIDSRPSDAIALALRFNAKILVNEKLLEEIRISPFEKIEEKRRRFFDI